MTMLADRTILRVTGPDVRGFLQGLVTQDMAAPLPAWGALLTPQGKALFDFILWADGDDILIDGEASAVEALARRLSIYRLRRPIAIAVDPAMAVHWSPAPPPEVTVAVPDPRLSELGYRWLGPPDDAPQDAAWQAHRLALGVTEGRAELGDGETLWLECHARELHGVSFTKGCYVGQENTARMHHRAKVNRRLAVVPLGDAGDKVRVRRPDLGVMVELRRVEGWGDARRPAWLAAELPG